MTIDLFIVIIIFYNFLEKGCQKRLILSLLQIK